MLHLDGVTWILWLSLLCSLNHVPQILTLVLEKWGVTHGRKCRLRHQGARVPCWWLLLWITWIRRQLNEEHNELGMMLVPCNGDIMLPLAMSKRDGRGKARRGQTRAQAHGGRNSPINRARLLKPASQKWPIKSFKCWLFDILFWGKWNKRLHWLI